MKTLFLLLLVLTAPLARLASAQDLLEEAKAQYAAAAYEDALSTLTRMADAQSNRVELEQYRAFCFIALGKLPDAERAVASLVLADPTYVPSATVASPRVLSLVSEMRRKELPAVARRLFDEGRTAFKEKNHARAQQSFDLLLQLLDEPAMKGRPENEDLRTLAQGFSALVGATPAPAAPAPKAAEAAPTPAPAETETPRETVVLPPVALQQALPEWVPPDAISSSRDFNGAIKVTIGTDGKVKSASIHRPSYPAYDARLLQASRGWTYRPATRNGEPVESEKIIEIQLRRRD